MTAKRYTRGIALLLALCLMAGCGQPQDITDRRIVKRTVDVKKHKEPEVVDSFTEKEPEIFAESVTETEEIETESTNVSEGETETEEKPKKRTGEPSSVKATEDTFDYVALGNSVTCNAISDLWWGKWGMAASSEDKDYVHVIASWLKNQSVKPVSTTVLDLKKWEVAKDRNSISSDYKGYFNEHTDLITIQTGENVTEFKDTLESDYSSLLRMIREKAPNAQILMLGEVLWPAEDIEAPKHSACDQNGVTFVEMTDFLNDYEGFYKSCVGTPVKGSDGGSYTIENEVVAAHPNDEGMDCIAQIVIENIVVSD